MAASESVPIEPGNLKFFYIKGSSFRVLHVDGALGGITPRGYIHFSVYSERPAIPQTTEHTLSPEGALSPATSVEGKAGIVRELDADLIMSKLTATELRDFLSSRLGELDRLEADAAAETSACVMRCSDFGLTSIRQREAGHQFTSRPHVGRSLLARPMRLHPADMMSARLRNPWKRRFAASSTN
jgi:hypothetical protein